MKASLVERQAKLVKEARLKQGQTQSFVADKIGMTRSSYCLMENGKRKIMALELAALCELWGKSYNEMFVKG